MISEKTLEMIEEFPPMRAMVVEIDAATVLWIKPVERGLIQISLRQYPGHGYKAKGELPMRAVTFWEQWMRPYVQPFLREYWKSAAQERLQENDFETAAGILQNVECPLLVPYAESGASLERYTTQAWWNEDKQYLEAAVTPNRIVLMTNGGAFEVDRIQTLLEIWSFLVESIQFFEETRQRLEKEWAEWDSSDQLQISK